MELANQTQDCSQDTAETAPDANGDKDILNAAGFESGAYGELVRRTAEKPLVFSFSWHGTHFKSSVEGHDGNVRLTLFSDLAAIPFSVENPDARGELLAFCEAFAGDDDAADHDVQINVVNGQSISIEHDIALPASQSDTMAALVTQLTKLVLQSAPYLDLIAECTATPAEA